jgi:hypothetical protein
MGIDVFVVMSIIQQAAQDLASWVLVTIAATVAAAIRTWWSIQRRLKQIEGELNMGADESRIEAIEADIERQDRYFLGDPNDPGDPGLLRRVHDMDEKIDRILDHVEREENDDE